MHLTCTGQWAARHIAPDQGIRIVTVNETITERNGAPVAELEERCTVPVWINWAEPNSFAR